jgi:hypothetical protein
MCTVATTRYNWNIVESGIKHHLYVYIYFPRIIQDKYTILVHCRSIWVICVWGLETWEKARLRRAFSRVYKNVIYYDYYMFFLYINTLEYLFYPAMTAFTDQYSLGETSPSFFPRFAPNTHIYLHASTVHMYCIYPAILNRK